MAAATGISCRDARRYGAVMADDPQRQARLAQALRLNLRRRKAQARDLAMPDEPADLTPPAAPSPR